MTGNLTESRANGTSLNRLTSAGATNSSWGQSYDYDGFGNLTNQNVTAGTVPPLSVVYNASTNRQTTDCTDANGNILGGTLSGGSCSGQLYSYDVANRMHPLTGSYYSYAPGNKRVWRGAMDNSGNITLDEVTFWSVTGQRLATYNLSQTANLTTTVLTESLAVSRTYFGGRLIANGAGNVATDRLGSIGKYYPWGQVKPSGNVVGTEGFTGYFRDAETTLDYADQRYHQPGMGRFVTPDPYMASGGPGDPGSWNRYAYAGGDPINGTDPSGREVCDPDEGDDCNSCVDDGDCNDDGGGGGGNFTSSQITGYDADGNPIIGDITQTNSNAAVTVTGDSDGPSTLTGQLGLFLQNQFGGNYPIIMGIGSSAPNPTPYPTRLFGTHWCGPGGAGPVVNGLDGACQAHDNCYEANGLGVSSNFNLTISPSMGQALTTCNQNLCNFAFSSNDPGATRVGLYFTLVPTVGACGTGTFVPRRSSAPLIPVITPQ